MEINLFKTSPLVRDKFWRLADPILSGEHHGKELEIMNDLLKELGAEYEVWDFINEKYARIRYGEHNIDSYVYGHLCNHIGHVWSNHKMYRNVAQDHDICPLCGMYHTAGKRNFINGDTVGLDDAVVYVCNACSDIFWVCDECGETGMGNAGGTWVDDARLCKSCFTEQLDREDIVMCENCSCFTKDWKNHIDTNGNDRRLCNICYHERGHRCADCDQRLYDHLDRFRFHNDETYCKECYGDHAVVAEYDHFDPDPPILQTDSERRRHDTLMFGLEFEYEMDWGKFYREGMDEAYIGKMMADCVPNKKWGYVKHDGSMQHGVEFATNPMTELFYTKNRKVISEILIKWKKAGFRTDQWDEEEQRYNCSLHMHMSKAAFTSAHIYKFVRFFYKAHMRKLVQAICQRDANKFAQFKRDDFRKTVQLAKDKANVSGDRYSVINLIGGHWHENQGRKSATVEFRLFQASLDPDIVHKNIEFMLGVYRFTRDNSITHITQKNFFKFLRKTKNRYRYLINFLNDNLGKEI
jgi:hypothetical protein